MHFFPHPLIWSPIEWFNKSLFQRLHNTISTCKSHPKGDIVPFWGVIEAF
jgi:hypothetical protein